MTAPSKDTVRDLAIHGGAPAFDAPVHVGLPNLEGRETFLRLVGEALDRRWVTNDGPLLRELEQRVAERLGVAHCVAMTNGTLALQVAVKAAGVTGEVVVPSYTFVATAHALEWIGLTPVFADIDPRTHCLDPAAVEAAITPRTSAIVPVHLWGRPAPVDELAAVAERHGLTLMYDAAHAFASSSRGRPVGGFGAAEVLSFHATKFVNSLEGGAVVTDDDELADRMRRLRNFGFVGFDDVRSPGTNAKMHEVSAAMGLASLEQLDGLIAANAAAYRHYREALEPVAGVRLLELDPADTPNYQYVVVELDDDLAHRRDHVVEALNAENVVARRYFWPGVHRMQPYADRDPDAAARLRETERVAARVVVLPTGPTISAEMVATIVRVLELALHHDG